MSINLSKGQTISLSKDGGGGLTRVFMGCGWDPAQQKKKGFFSGLLGGGAADEIDLDASVILFDGNRAEVDMVYYGQLNSKDGSIRHGGDNLTGAGDGDDEVIYVDLARLDSRVHYLVFTVNSFRGQTFNEVENAFARLVDETAGKEICRYQLAEQGPHTGVIMASMAKTGTGWQMTAHGRPADGRSARDIAAAAAAIL
ncbi:MAG: TerD family protein [Rhodobacteraceae bacterium]|nr:TerD family protein [Paracoccaceae bacterium]